jgi:hypothetical protein
MKLLAHLSENGTRVAFLTNSGVEDVVPETEDACTVIAAGGTPSTNGKSKPFA